MSYPLNYPTPQNANVQIFYGSNGATGTPEMKQTWIKPQGASFVWFTLIGAGGGNDGAGTGGGSGAVTNFMCPAFLIPDELGVSVGRGISYAGTPIDTTITYYGSKSSNGYTLLTAKSGADNAAGTASAVNSFTAIGFYQSISGQNGSTGTVNASNTTFLSGGGGGSSAQTSNYGYSSGGATAPSSRDGFFQMSPIIVGAGGMVQGRGGIGCGGGTSGRGGDGLVVIITW